VWHGSQREFRGKVVTESSQLSRVVVKKKKLKSQIEKQESGSQRELVLLLADFSVFFWFCESFNLLGAMTPRLGKQQTMQVLKRESEKKHAQERER
jgi:DNA polymerase III delta prime subunit